MVFSSIITDILSHNIDIYIYNEVATILAGPQCSHRGTWLNTSYVKVTRDQTTRIKFFNESTQNYMSE